MEVVVEGLSKVYGGRVRALSGVGLEIPTGMYGLLGPNGAGKTTLMRILAGILRPTSGMVRIGGFDCSTESGQTAVKRTLGYLPQDLGLYPDLSAREFLDYIGILKGLGDKKERRRRVEELLGVMRLEDVAKRKLKGFSGGMRRRVGIAQALLNDPRLLIVDEPTAGLDPEERIPLPQLAFRPRRRPDGAPQHSYSRGCGPDQPQPGRAGRRRSPVPGDDVRPDQKRKRQSLHRRDRRPRNPTANLTVVSTLHLGNSVQYRVVGVPPPHLEAEEAPPSLEDGYVWLMRERRTAEVI